MSSAPAAGGPPALPRVQEPPEGLTRARWLYVDEAMSHEVHAGLRPGAPPQFVAREAAYGNTDAAEVLETITPVPEAWEAQLAHLDLETRLSLIGRYWRHDALKPGWTRLRPPPAGEHADLREVDIALFPGDASFYHFSPARASGQHVLVLRLPMFHAQGLRFLFARMEAAIAAPERGTLTLLHARLPVTPMRSLLVREHRHWQSKGLAKLVRPEHFAESLGADWKRDILTFYKETLDRIARGEWGTPAPQAANDAPLDPVYTDYVRWLRDPRVAAIHARFLTPEEEASLLAGGEAFIRQAIARKRAHASANDQVLLAVLEASLLARDALRHDAHKVDPEVAALVRRFAYYL